MINLDQEISFIIDNNFNNNIYDKDSTEYFIQNLLNKTTIKVSNKWVDKIFYGINNTIYFEMHKDLSKRKNGYLWCRYEKFWSILRNEYLLNDIQIIKIITNVFENHFKCVVGKPKVNPISFNYKNYFKK